MTHNGGYAGNDDEDANIRDTRYFLQILRLLLDYQLITLDDLSSVLEPTALFNFVNSCESSFGGYSFTPDDLSPNMCSTRSALGAVKILETFRLIGVFYEDKEYARAYNYFFNRLLSVRDFIKNCRSSSDMYAYWAFLKELLKIKNADKTEHHDKLSAIG